MRQLTSIQIIRDILPHNNADTLEIAKVLGWTLCVMKDQFKKDQRVVFVEPDAILPEGQPAWEFMRARGFRIKTIKLRGVISQGLVFPLSILPEGNYEDGQYVDEILGITQYQPYTPAQLAGEVKGSFPDFLFKSDEIRIQAVPELLDKHQDKKFYVSEKCDGSSMTVFLNNGVFGVCSRNLELRETEGNSFWKVARELDLENRMATFVLNSGAYLLNFSLQGELVGPGVQGNKYKLDKLTFLIFNVFDIDRRRFLNYTDFRDVIHNLDLTYVPLISYDFLLPKTVDDLIEYSKGKSLLNPTVHREGIVLRPLVEEYSEDLRGRLSFKTINPDFLLKYNE
jgi:RNA ligase (TIGR02306 family)